MVLHPRTSTATKEITKCLLSCLASGSVITLATFLSPPTYKARYQKNIALRELEQYTRNRIDQTLRRLRLLKYIQYDLTDEKQPILLTKRGMQRVTHYRLRDCLRKALRQWDHLWRVVIFDIPKHQDSIRHHLRRELLMAGFYPLQRSVYVTPFSCEKEIEALCAHLRIQPHVVYFVAASLGPAERKVQDFFRRREEDSLT